MPNNVVQTRHTDYHLSRTTCGARYTSARTEPPDAEQLERSTDYPEFLDR